MSSINQIRPAISVVICAHNPRFNYINRVLESLKNQTLSKEFWELLLIDNASKYPLEEKIDVNWNSQARHIRENKLGLTHARLRGIQEAVAETIIFVDDDNVLDCNYLKIALEISQKWSMLGAWGGQVKPEFEEEPPEWTKQYWGFLAIREFSEDRWSNIPHQNDAIPCGAGFCVRKDVAEKYAQLVYNDLRRESLGRTGEMLTSCEDSDLAYTAWDLNLGTGLFTQLKLTHLIPSSRLEEEYLLRLVKGLSYSGIILDSFRDKVPTPNSWKQKILNFYSRLKKDARGRRFHDAFEEGKRLALKEIFSK